MNGDDDHDPQAESDAAISQATGGSQATSGRSGWKKVLTLLAVGAVMAVAWTKYRDALTLDNLAAQEAVLRGYQQSHPVLVYGAAFVLYVVVTGLSLPGATILTLTFGWYFGFWRSVLLVSFASTAGATLAFLLSRYILRDAVQSRFGERLAGFNAALEREGAFYLFTLRLIPAVPFFRAGRRDRHHHARVPRSGLQRSPQATRPRPDALRTAHSRHRRCSPPRPPETNDGVDRLYRPDANPLGHHTRSWPDETHRHSRHRRSDHVGDSHARADPGLLHAPQTLGTVAAFAKG
ncbi:MAG: TVP38/TMEM64 family protein [Planctomycetota bacterium]|nr:TVP38/TMEM64 family protein [Planctomycetota bacterium]